MELVYKYRTIDYPVPAQSVGERLEELDREFGEVTPKIMVEDARPEGALMHPMYEWDDSIAAEKYRYGQARKITSELVIVQATAKDPEIQEPIRAFVSVKPRNESASYRPIVTALSEEDTKNQIIANAKLELEACERKYRGIIDIVPILEDVLAKLKS